MRNLDEIISETLGTPDIEWGNDEVMLQEFDCEISETDWDEEPTSGEGDAITYGQFEALNKVNAHAIFILSDNIVSSYSTPEAIITDPAVVQHLTEQIQTSPISQKELSAIGCQNIDSAKFTLAEPTIRDKKLEVFIDLEVRGRAVREELIANDIPIEEGMEVNVNKIIPGAISIPKGEYIVWQVVGNKCTLVPTRESNLETFEIMRPTLAGFLNPDIHKKVINKPGPTINERQLRR